MGIQDRVYPYSTAGVAGVINVPNWLWRPLDPPPQPRVLFYKERNPGNSVG